MTKPEVTDTTKIKGTIEGQFSLEAELHEEGRRQFIRTYSKEKRKGRISKGTIGQRTIGVVIGDVSEGIRSWLDYNQHHNLGRKHTAFKLIKHIEPETLAYLGLLVCLDKVCTDDNPLTSVAFSIAKEIETEIEGRLVKGISRDLFDLVKRKSETQGSTSKVFFQRNIREQRDKTYHEPWTLEQKSHVGIAILNIIIETTGFFERYRFQAASPKARKWMLAPSDRLVEWLHHLMKRMEYMSPVNLPMIVPPKPWTGPFEGGYLSNLKDRPFIKDNDSEFVKTRTPKEMPLVYEAINNAQETAFKINENILDAFEVAINSSLEIGELPPIKDIEPPPKPEDIATNEEARKSWRKKASNIHMANAALKSKRILALRILMIAKRMVKYEGLYFPYCVDFRGRLYAIPGLLNPQGNQWAKAMLLFGEGKRVGEAGARWLRIHAANMAGIDKVALTERVAWSVKHTPQMVSVANDPWGPDRDFWITADKPWQFLAACFEVAGLERDGVDYVSHMPVLIDGTCNGIQHFAAMRRDPEAGRTTNLRPSDSPQDIYRHVAEVTERAVKGDAVPGHHDPGSKAWMAARLADIPLTRDIVKKTVMCLPYGLGQTSARKYIWEAIKKKFVGETLEHIKYENTDSPDTDRFHAIWMASIVLTPHVWKSIQETLPSALSSMKWLKSISQAVTKAGEFLTWETPDGFLARNIYYDKKQIQIRTVINGCPTLLSVLRTLDKLDSKRISQAFPPNFVHSLDATALRMFINQCKLEGFDNFYLVHDTVGGLPSEMDDIQRIIKESFVKLYTDNDPISMIFDKYGHLIKADTVSYPGMGNLDINDVLSSDYFFS